MVSTSTYTHNCRKKQQQKTDESVICNYYHGCLSKINIQYIVNALNGQINIDTWPSHACGFSSTYSYKIKHINCQQCLYTMQDPQWFVMVSVEKILHRALTLTSWNTFGMNWNTKCTPILLTWHHCLTTLVTEWTQIHTAALKYCTSESLLWGVEVIITAKIGQNLDEQHMSGTVRCPQTFGHIVYSVTRLIEFLFTLKAPTSDLTSCREF